MGWVLISQALPPTSNDGSERIISSRLLVKTGDYVEIARMIDADDDTNDDCVYWVNDAGFTVNPDSWQPLPI